MLQYPPSSGFVSTFSFSHITAKRFQNGMSVYVSPAVPVDDGNVYQ